MNVAGQTVQSASPPTSGCVVLGCFCQSRVSEPAYLFSPGDLTIAGVFPVHEIGEDPYSCGDIAKRSLGYQLAEAFWYAVKNVNQKAGKFRKILPGIQLGSVTVDSCQNSARVSHVMGGLLGGEIQALNENRSLTISDLFAVIGGSYSLQPMLKASALPHITLGSGSEEQGTECTVQSSH